MTEDEGVSIADLPPHTQWELYELCQRRAEIGEEAFCDQLAATLEIPREMLDKACVIAAVSPDLCQMVQCDQIDFNIAFEIARKRMVKARN